MLMFAANRSVFPVPMLAAFASMPSHAMSSAPSIIYTSESFGSWVRVDVLGTVPSHMLHELGGFTMVPKMLVI